MPLHDRCMLSPASIPQESSCHHLWHPPMLHDHSPGRQAPPPTCKRACLEILCPALHRDDQGLHEDGLCRKKKRRLHFGCMPLLHLVIWQSRAAPGTPPAGRWHSTASEVRGTLTTAVAVKLSWTARSSSFWGSRAPSAAASAHRLSPQQRRGVLQGNTMKKEGSGAHLHNGIGREAELDRALEQLPRVARAERRRVRAPLRQPPRPPAPPQPPQPSRGVAGPRGVPRGVSRRAARHDLVPDKGAGQCQGCRSRHLPPL